MSGRRLKELFHVNNGRAAVCGARLVPAAFDTAGVVQKGIVEIK
jgi:hypothetical protein